MAAERPGTPKHALARTAVDPSWIWWTVLAGCGVTLGVMGLAGPAQRALDGGPAARLVAHVPDPLAALALGSGALTALCILWLLLPRGIRRRRKEDEEHELYYEPPKVPAWAMIIIWAFVLLPFAGIGYLLWQSWTRFQQGGALLSRHQGLWAPPQRPFSPLGPEAAASPALWNVAVATLALVAGLGSLVLVLWILFGDRLARWWAGPLPEHRREMLAEAVDESLDDLAREPDARVAIIKCYRRFEQVLARTRVPRAPWQTPMEFMREALRRLPLPPEAVQRLTELFEVARFSDHPLGAPDRSSAFESLVEIRAGLPPEKVDASAA